MRWLFAFGLLVPCTVFAQSPSTPRKATVEDFKKLRTTQEKLHFLDQNIDKMGRQTFEDIYTLLDKKKDVPVLLLWHFFKYVYWFALNYPFEEAYQSLLKMSELSKKYAITEAEIAADFQIKMRMYSLNQLSEQQMYAEHLSFASKVKTVGLQKFKYYNLDVFLYNIGRTFFSLDDSEKALEILKIAEANKSPKGYALIHHTLTLNLIQTIYASEKNYPQAIVYARKIYDFNEGWNSFKEESDYWRKAFWQGLSSLDIASYYMEMGDFKNAEKYANLGYTLYKADYDLEADYNLIHQKLIGEFEALQVMIRLKLRMGSMVEVEKLFQRVEKIRPLIRFNDAANYFKSLPLYRNYTLFYEKKREFARAYSYLKLAKTMEDSLARRNDKRKLWQMQTRVDAERYQSEIAVAEANTQQQLFSRNLAIWALLSVIMLAVIIYLRIKRDNETIHLQSDLLQKSLSEKETLLREIHHRVKNNLQIIAGLFEKQARFTQNVKAQKLMKEGQNRIYSIALVHQNLYQTENLSSIELKPYLEMLTKNIEKSHYPNHFEIDLILDVDETVVDIDTAIPLGLIINELVTNCYKYAFIDYKKGSILVKFASTNGHCVLEVEDNGCGIPTDFDFTQSKSLGLNLVRGLVRQIDGILHFPKTDIGTSCIISFKR